jgi:hypothetical protein
VLSACKLNLPLVPSQDYVYKITRGATTTLWVTGISDPLQMYSGRLDEHDWWYAILDIIFFLQT